METKDEKLGRNKSYTDIVIHRDKKQNYISTESIHDHSIENDDVRPNLYSSNDDANTWIHCKPSYM